jgi:serine/threonine-protein kinase HipA
MTTARVLLWGSDIGAVTWVPEREVGVFQYTPAFAASGIQVAPLMMPLREAAYEFAALPRETFKGLPGLLADSLPDKFGNAIIDAWLASQGRNAADFNPVERLCYTGARGMGALEFKPAFAVAGNTSRRIDVEALVDLANRVLDERISMQGKLAAADDTRVIEDILRVGTSAGGARAKAIVAWNETTGEFRSGQVPVAEGFSHWLIKFDGVQSNRDRELADPMGFGRIEYAYYLMARAADIDMPTCRLYEEGGRAHFMTRRFDRCEDGDKLHMQSLCALMHYDYNQPDAYSYEQALQTIRRLDLSMADMEQQLRRAMFNLLARNQDDHVKNIAFLMNRAGQWRLSPAFDVAYAYNPDGFWTGHHQMSVNGRRDGFRVDDIVELARTGGIKPGRAKTMLDEVADTVERWPDFAAQAGIDDVTVSRIQAALRLDLRP